MAEQRKPNKTDKAVASQPVKVIFEPEVRRKLGGIVHSTLWRMLRDPDSELPKPIRISKRRNGWIESDIDAYIASRPTAPAFRGQATEVERV